MVCATKSISHGHCHSIVSFVLDLNLIIKLLVEDTIFDYQFDKKSNNSEFTNLYFGRIKSITVEGLLDLY